MADFSTIQPPITSLRLGEIKLHLAKAYLHQMVEVSTDQDGFRYVKDKLSDQHFQISEESAHVLAFKEECQGLYPSLHYSGCGGPRCMSDFTYIDEDVLQKLELELRDQTHWGCTEIPTTFALGNNSYAF